MTSTTTGSLLNPGNSTPQNGWQAYTPALQGATDNAVATLSTAIGRFALFQNICFLKIKMVSTTMTKTTLTDLVQVPIPLPAATLTSDNNQMSARVENGTAVANMNVFEIASAAVFGTFRNYALAASSSQLTYAVTTPGIGVLTNTITLIATGYYEY